MTRSTRSPAADTSLSAPSRACWAISTATRFTRSTGPVDRVRRVPVPEPDALLRAVARLAVVARRVAADFLVAAELLEVEPPEVEPERLLVERPEELDVLLPVAPFLAVPLLEVVLFDAPLLDAVLLDVVLRPPVVRLLAEVPFLALPAAERFVVVPLFRAVVVPFRALELLFLAVLPPVLERPADVVFLAVAPRLVVVPRFAAVLLLVVVPRLAALERFVAPARFAVPERPAVLERFVVLPLVEVADALAPRFRAAVPDLLVAPELRRFAVLPDPAEERERVVRVLLLPDEPEVLRGLPERVAMMCAPGGGLYPCVQESRAHLHPACRGSTAGAPTWCPRRSRRSRRRAMDARRSVAGRAALTRASVPILAHPAAGELA